MVVHSSYFIQNVNDPWNIFHMDSNKLFHYILDYIIMDNIISQVFNCN